MDLRDRARSDLYLAQLRTQSAPNTPGFGPKSPAFSQYAMSPRFPPTAFKSLGDIAESPAFTPAPAAEPQSAFATPKTSSSQTFVLQAPPTKAPSATPKLGGLKTPTSPNAPALAHNVNEHGPVATGEQIYEAVPIPGAYADQAFKSPSANQTSFGLAR